MNFTLSAQDPQSCGGGGGGQVLIQSAMISSTASRIAHSWSQLGAEAAYICTTFGCCVPLVWPTKIIIRVPLCNSSMEPHHRLSGTSVIASSIALASCHNWRSNAHRCPLIQTAGLTAFRPYFAEFLCFWPIGVIPRPEYCPLGLRRLAMTGGSRGV